MISVVRQNLAIYHLKKGVIACPTDTVLGLSCLPCNMTAINKILTLKQRSATKGLILIASDIHYFAPFVDNILMLQQFEKASKTAAKPTTYLLKASRNTGFLLTGKFDTIAIRLTNQPLIKTLCNACNSALVSTSANITGKPVATSILGLKVLFADKLNFIIAPTKSPQHKPSLIVDLQTQERHR